MRTSILLAMVGVALVAASDSGAAAVGSGRPAPTRDVAARVADNPAAALPLHFEENLGQVDPQVRFLARSRGYTAYLTPSETVFELHAGERDEEPGAVDLDVLRMRFRDADTGAEVLGHDEMDGRSHYFLGADPASWVREVPHVGRVVQRGIYPGVDVQWRSAPGRALAYDLHVAPGGDPAVIELEFEGADGIRLAEDGALVVATPHGELRHERPHVFQASRRGVRRDVSGRFELRDALRVGFNVGSYDKARPLVIDPTIKYSTYMGANEPDLATDIAADSAGAAYVTGFVINSPNFPTKSPYQSTLKGARDAVVFKINATGSALVYSTFLGGGGSNDLGQGIAVDSSGSAYVVGQTDSSDFPTKSPVQASHGGGNDDLFLTKFNAAGSALVYSTYHGGSGNDLDARVTVDASGAAYVVGRSVSSDFPTKGAIYGSKSGGVDAVLTKFAASGASLSYSTYLGGGSGDAARAVAVDSTGAAYVVGSTGSSDFPTKSPLQSTNGGSDDVFVTKVNAAGSAVVYSTYLGGGAKEDAAGIAVDSNGDAYVSGSTESSDFPTKSPIQATLGGKRDAFVAKLKSDGSSLVYSTYLGGSGDEGRIGAGPGGVGVSAGGAATVITSTWSTDATTVSAIQSTNGGNGDVYVASLNSAGSAITFATYHGGSGFELAYSASLGPKGAIYVAGTTGSTDLPLTGAIQSTHSNTSFDEIFVLKVSSPTPPNTPTSLEVTGSTSTRVNLGWTDVSADETKFELERKTGTGVFGALAEPAADATTYADASVTGDTTYTYRIRAINDNGASEWSNEAQVVTIDSPDQLTADAVSNTRIDLMWRDRSGSEDGFAVERKRAGDDYLALGSVDAAVTSFADTGADPETTYSFRVRATKGAGASGWSNVVEVTTPPADPADVIPNTRSDTEVRISWKDLSSAESGYEIERGVGCPATSFARIVTVGPDVVEYTDRSALPETTYSYRVRAVNQHGESEYTAPVCITTAPIAPSAFAGTAASPSRIRLAWTDNSGIEQGYEVQRTPAGRDDWADIADLPADASEYLDVGVSQEAAFSYRVRAYDDNGRSRNAMAEGVSTPAALVVRSAKLTIPTGKKAKRKKPTLVAKGEMDIGGTQVDFEGAATLWIGDTQVAIDGFTSLRRGKLLRYDENGIRLDLKPSAKGASRVPFSLRVVGDVAAALEKDGELFLRFKSGAFDAMGVVTLLGGQFNPARGKGTWIDPELNLLSVAATPKRKSFKMRATFPPDELPDTAPEVSVLLDIFEISFEPTAFKQRGPTKYVLSRKLGPVRQKVILDYRRGTLTIVLRGVALQTYEPGTVLVPLAVSIGTTRLQDKPLLVVSKRSFRY